MSAADKPKTRFTGIKGQYEYRKRLHEHLNQDDPTLTIVALLNLPPSLKQPQTYFTRICL